MVTSGLIAGGGSDHSIFDGVGGNSGEYDAHHHRSGCRRYTLSSNFSATEENMLRRFCENVSDSVRKS